MTDPDLQSLWQSQRSEEPPMALDEIRAKARKFQDRIRVRNWIEYVAGVFVTAMFVWQGLEADHVLAQAGAWVTVVAVFVVLWQLHARGGARQPPQAPAVALLDFHRAELKRQRDAVYSVPLWYLAPFLPGTSLIFAARFLQERAEPDGGEMIRLVGGGAIVVVVFGGIMLLNRLAGRALQKEIDELDAVRRG